MTVACAGRGRLHSFPKSKTRSYGVFFPVRLRGEHAGIEKRPDSVQNGIRRQILQKIRSLRLQGSIPYYFTSCGEGCRKNISSLRDVDFGQPRATGECDEADFRYAIWDCDIGKNILNPAMKSGRYQQQHIPDYCCMRFVRN